MRKQFFSFTLGPLSFALSLVSALLSTHCLRADAQQAGKIPRIGFVASTSPDDRNLQAFRQGLVDLGYIDGKNILVEYRHAQGKNERLPELTSELLQTKVDILISSSSPAILAAKKESRTTPIIMITTVDPVATGLVEDLARPGGNVTGLTRLTRDLSGKRLELFKEVVPGLVRVAILASMTNSTGARQRNNFQHFEAPAHALKLQLHPVRVRGPNPALEEAFREAVKGRSNGLVVVRTGVLLLHTKQIAELAIKHRLPSMHEAADSVETGGLVSYSASDTDLFRRAATYVDKILKGTKPADLPVEQPTRFEFVINLKTAKQIGLTIPPNVLARADRVIR
jgi:putative tryptophan/tyrosine transport system substrate-binding protein